MCTWEYICTALNHARHHQSHGCFIYYFIVCGYSRVMIEGYLYIDEGSLPSSSSSYMIFIYRWDPNMFIVQLNFLFANIIYIIYTYIYNLTIIIGKNETYKINIFNEWIYFLFNSSRQVGIRWSFFGKRCRGAYPTERSFWHRQSGALRLSGPADKTQDLVRPIVQRSPSRRSVSRAQRVWLDAWRLRQGLYTTGNVMVIIIHTYMLYT